MKRRLERTYEELKHWTPLGRAGMPTAFRAYL